MRFGLVLLASTLSACAMPTAAQSVCVLDGGTANTPLSLTVGFGFSGCGTTDAKCTATIDGGTITLETSATVCPTGCSPGGTVPRASCQLPPLPPGTYRVLPFGQTLVLSSDGGATGC